MKQEKGQVQQKDSQSGQTQQGQQNAATEVPAYPTAVSVMIHSVHMGGTTLADASVNLNGVFAIRGVKVMQGKNGPFVSMPSRVNQNGEFQDVCFPVTKDFRDQLHGAVLGAYQQAMTQLYEEQMAQMQGQTQPQPTQQMDGPAMQQM